MGTGIQQKILEDPYCLWSTWYYRPSFFYNLKTYKALKQAYIYISDTIPANDMLIESQFRNLSPESIRTYRNSYRQNVDYSVLFFLLFWGLNVVDATVDAHLKAFDVSNDVTLKIKPTLNSNSAGVSLVFAFKDKRSKTLSSIPLIFNLFFYKTKFRL